MIRLYITSLLIYNHFILFVNSTDPRKSETYNRNISRKFLKPQYTYTPDEDFKPAYYTLDPSDTKRLALIEEHLVAAFSDIISNENKSSKDQICLRYLQKYINDFNRDNQAVQGKRGIHRANIVTDNPNLTFRMIRRIVITIFNHTIHSCKNSVLDVETTINDTFAAFDLTPPTQQDLEDALAGLLRIHFIYGFNATSEIYLGIFNRVKTEAKLCFEDCLALGLKAIQFKAEALAYQWLISASVELIEIQKSNEESSEEEKELENAWLELQLFAKVENLTALHQLPHDRQESLFGVYYNYGFYASCRGESEQPIEHQSQLRCFNQFNWNHYFYINPVKTEVLCAQPLIYQFYDFVGNQTLDYIRKSVRKKLKYFGVPSKGNGEIDYSLVRTSMNAWYLNQYHPKMVKLSKRIEKLTGLKLSKDLTNANLLVGRYGSLGGHYDFHLDSLQNTSLNIAKQGDRITTFLMYMSDVKMGGYTGFPLAKTFAKPIKGSAILWYNTMLNGKVDPRTRHGSCPVILGTKEIANRWIYQYDNMFKKPCTLDPEE